MWKYLFAGVSALALGFSASAYAEPSIGLSGANAANTGVLTFTGTSTIPNSITFGLGGTFLGNGTYFGNTTTDVGTYTLSNFTPNPVASTGNAAGNFPLSSFSLDFSWMGNDGDSMTATATFNLLTDSTHTPGLTNAGVNPFNLVVDSVSGDSDFTSAFPVGFTRIMELSFDVITPLDSLDGSENPIVSAGEVTVPAPAIGHGLPAALAIGGLLLGAGLWEHKKRLSPRPPATT